MNAVRRPYRKLASDMIKTARLLEIVANFFPSFKMSQVVNREAKASERAQGNGLPRVASKKTPYLSKDAFAKFNARVASEEDDENYAFRVASKDAEGFEFLFRRAYLEELLTRQTSNKSKQALKKQKQKKLQQLQSEFASINQTLQGQQPDLTEIVYFENRRSRAPLVINLDPRKVERDVSYAEKLREIADAKRVYFESLKETSAPPSKRKRLRGGGGGDPRTIISVALSREWWNDRQFRSLVMDSLGPVSGTKLLEKPVVASREKRTAGRVIVRTLMYLAQTHPEAVMEKARDVLLGASTNQLLDEEGNVIADDIKANNKSAEGIARIVANNQNISFVNVANGDKVFVNAVQNIVKSLVMDIQRDYTTLLERGRGAFSDEEVRRQRSKSIDSLIDTLSRQIEEVEASVAKGNSPPVGFENKKKRLQRLTEAKEKGAVSAVSGYFGHSLEIGSAGTNVFSGSPEEGGEEGEGLLARVEGEASSASMPNLSLYMSEDALVEIYEALDKPRESRTFEEVAISEDVMKPIRDRLIQDIANSRNLDPDFHDYYMGLSANQRNIFVRFCNTWTSVSKKKIKIGNKVAPSDPGRLEAFRSKLNKDEKAELERKLDQRELDVYMGKHIVKLAEDKFKANFNQSQALRAINAVFQKSEDVAGMDQVQDAVLGREALSDPQAKMLVKLGLDPSTLRSSNAKEIADLILMTTKVKAKKMTLAQVIRMMSAKDDLLSKYFASIDSKAGAIPSNLSYAIAYRLFAEGLSAEKIAEVLKKIGVKGIKSSAQGMLNEVAKNSSGDFSKASMGEPLTTDLATREALVEARRLFAELKESFEVSVKAEVDDFLEDFANDWYAVYLSEIRRPTGGSQSRVHMLDSKRPSTVREEVGMRFRKRIQNAKGYTSRQEAKISDLEEKIVAAENRKKSQRSKKFKDEIDSELVILRQDLATEQARKSSYEQEQSILESAYESFNKAIRESSVEGLNLTTNNRGLREKAGKLYRDIQEVLDSVKEGVGAIKKGRKIILEPRKMSIAQDFARIGRISASLEDNLCREYLTSKGIPHHIISEILPKRGAVGSVDRARKSLGEKQLSSRVQVAEGVEITKGEILDILEHVFSGQYISTADANPRMYRLLSEVDQHVKDNEMLVKIFDLSQKLVRHHMYRYSIGASHAKIQMSEVGLADLEEVGLSMEALEAEFEKSPRKVQNFISESRLDTLKVRYKALVSNGDITNEHYQAVTNAANLLDSNRFLSSDDVSYFCRLILRNQYNEIELAEIVRSIREKIETKRGEFEAEKLRAEGLIEQAQQAKIRVTALANKLRKDGVDADQVKAIIGELEAKINGTQARAVSKKRVTEANVQALNLAQEIETVRREARTSQQNREQRALLSRWEETIAQAEEMGVSLRGIKRTPSRVDATMIANLERKIESAGNVAFFALNAKAPTPVQTKKAKSFKDKAEKALLAGDEVAYAEFMYQAYVITGNPDFYICDPGSGGADQRFYELMFDTLAKQAVEAGIYGDMKYLRRDYPQGASTPLSTLNMRLDERLKKRLKTRGDTDKAIAEQRGAEESLERVVTNSAELEVLKDVATKNAKGARDIADLLRMKSRVNPKVLEDEVNKLEALLTNAESSLTTLVSDRADLVKAKRKGDTEAASTLVELDAKIKSARALVSERKRGLKKANTAVKRNKPVEGIEKLALVAKKLGIRVTARSTEASLKRNIVSKIDEQVESIKSTFIEEGADTVISAEDLNIKARSVGGDISAFDLNTVEGRKEADNYINRVYSAPNKDALAEISRNESINLSSFDLNTFSGRYSAFQHIKSVRVARTTQAITPQKKPRVRQEFAEADTEAKRKKRLEEAAQKAQAERAKIRKERRERLDRAKARSTERAQRMTTKTTAPTTPTISAEELSADRQFLDLRGRSISGLKVKDLKALSVKYGLTPSVTTATKEEARKAILREIGKRLKAELARLEERSSRGRTKRTKTTKATKPKTTKSTKTTKPTRAIAKKVADLQADFSALADSSIKATPLKAIAKKHGVAYVAKEGLEKNRRAVKRAVKKLLNQAIEEAGAQLVDTAKKPKSTKRTKTTKSKTTKSKTTKSKTTKRTKTTKSKTTKSTKTTKKPKSTKTTKRRKQASDLQSFAQLSLAYPGLRGDISEYLAHNL